MEYIEIHIVASSGAITSNLKFHSPEKANTFFDTLCKGGETIVTYSENHKTIEHKDGTSSRMYKQHMTFQDE